MTYIEIPADQIPDSIVFDVPRRHAGQIIEVAYGQHRSRRDGADVGDPYKRITDRSDGTVTYYRRA